MTPPLFRVARVFGHCAQLDETIILMNDKSVHTFILIFLRFLSLFTPADQCELICLNRAQQHVAATKIQALWRGWHIRHLIDVNTTKVSSLFY